MNENVNPLAEAGEQPASPRPLQRRGVRRVPLCQVWLITHAHFFGKGLCHGPARREQDGRYPHTPD
ncbi:MAG: hypothetical protein KatS3mg057_0403 [Herpetosiphonaceae bacterium]|nr:MAG: hypothetical protein KatS3mg057_0403 [Herpetosiphonaceae bacterium]